MTGEPGERPEHGGWPADDLDRRPPGPPYPPMPPMPPRGVPQVPLHAQPTRILPAVARPQPQREPAPEGEQQVPAPPPPVKRRRRGWIVALIVLVLVALAGVALAIPDVANRLQLPWAPNKPKGAEPAPVAVQRTIRGPEAGQPPTADGVTEVLRSASQNPALGSLTGTVVDPSDGKALWEQEQDKPLTPASTIKLLTAASALLALEPDATLTTRVVEGEQPGEVVLIGGGDPTLTALGKAEDSFYPGAATLDRLAAQVRKATGGEVDRVSVDLSAYTGATRGPGWAPEDAPSTFAAPLQAAMLDGGRENPQDFKSQRTGDPAGQVAEELAQRLDAQAGSTDVTAPDGAKELGKVSSAPLDELVATTLADSDNILAEALAHRVAVELGEEPSFEGAAKAMRKVLGDAGFSLKGVELSDASGLSVRNRVPARLLTDILSAAAGEGEQARRLRPLLEGLPVAGGTGTLAERYTDGPSEPAKGWVRAKTGTLSGVNTLAGVVLTKDGTVLAFSLMSSGTDPDSARPALDEVVAALRTCGCR